MAFGARGLLVIYFPILPIYGFPPLGTTGRLAWWRLTYPKHLTGFGTRHCYPSSPPLGFLFLFASLCLAFFQIAQYRLLLMGRLLLLFLSIVVFLRVLSYLLLYSYFSLMISPAHLTLSTHMPMTRPFILQLISILLHLLLLELPLVLIFPILFSLLDRICGWGRLNLVKFNSLKTQLLQIAISKIPSNFPISFDGSFVSPVDYINILGLNIKKMAWRPHITTVAGAASKKLGVLFRLRDCFFLLS